MYEIFEQLLQKHKITAYKVGKVTGIASSTFTDWKNGRSIPKQDKLQKIADYFNVPLEYLLGINEKKSSNIVLNDGVKEIAQTINFNDDLKELFELTKNMQPKKLKAYIDFMKAMQE